MIKGQLEEKAGEGTVDFDELPDSALVRLAQIVGHLVPVSRATWWRYVKAGNAPPPVKLSAGVTAWKVGELRSWLAKGTQ